MSAIHGSEFWRDHAETLAKNEMRVAAISLKLASHAISVSKRPDAIRVNVEHRFRNPGSSLAVGSENSGAFGALISRDTIGRGEVAWNRMSSTRGRPTM